MSCAIAAIGAIIHIDVRLGFIVSREDPPICYVIVQKHLRIIHYNSPTDENVILSRVTAPPISNAVGEFIRWQTRPG